MQAIRNNSSNSRHSNHILNTEAEPKATFNYIFLRLFVNLVSLPQCPNFASYSRNGYTDISCNFSSELIFTALGHSVRINE
jgi:hypothetical protein